MGKYETVVKLLEDDMFSQKISEIDTIEGIQDVFAEEGINLSAEEINEMVVAIKALSKESELSESDLENISGGKISIKLGSIISAFKMGWDAGGKFCDWMYKTFGIV